jgi:NAD-dependent DNA ligase
MEYENFTAKELEKELRKANEAYRLGNPYLSDEIYDYVYDLLKDRDPSNTFFSEIGAPIVDEKTKALLPYKMFSLDKVKAEEKPLALWVSKFPGDITVSDKLDGNSGLLYIKDKKISLFTRGDGYQGQDISYLVPYISFFKNEEFKNFVIQNYKEFAIRGELILSKEDWKIIKAKYPELSNDRNTVAGTLNAKSPNYDILKKIRFVSYEWIYGMNYSGEPVGSFKPSDYFVFMERLGLEVVHNEIVKGKDVTITTLSSILENRRSHGSYVIDGIVITQNAPHIRDDTGNPKYSFAFKTLATQEQAEVVVLGIEWNISKDGLLKPLVLFPPIELDGVIMRKATGKNAKFVEDNVIGPGAKIIITRAGGVIPDILKVTKIADSGKPGFPYDFDFVWNENHVEIMLNKVSLSEEAQDAWDMFEGNIGEKKLKLIADVYPDILDKQKRMTPSIDGLLTIPGIALITAENFLASLPNFWKFVEENGLLEYIDKDKDIQVPKNLGTVAMSTEQKEFLSKTFVFSGFRNKDWEEKVTSGGGNVASGVTKKVNYLIVKDKSESSNKIEKAKELGIPILSIEEAQKFFII